MSIRFVLIILFVVLNVSLTSCKQDSSLDEDLKRAKIHYLDKDMDKALRILEKIENRIDENTSIATKEQFERIKGAVYSELALPQKANQSFTNALEYALALNDTLSILIDSHNLSVYSDCRPEILEKALSMCREQDSTIRLYILEKLAQTYLYLGKLEQSEICLGELQQRGYPNISQIKFDKARIAFEQDSMLKARTILLSINTDSLNVSGKYDKFLLLKNLSIATTNYIDALSFCDSMSVYADSIKNIRGLERLQRAEKEYSQILQTERQQLHIILCSSIALLTIAVIVILIILHNLKLKRRQIELTDKIAELNVAIERQYQLMDSAKNSDNSEDIANLILDKFSLSYDIFSSTPEYDILKRLTLIHDLNSNHYQDIAQLRDGIVGRFSDACSDLRANFPTMTNDDCLFCAINVCKCSREIQSSLMAVSEDTLRKRKSRIKPKIPTSLFNYFFA